MAHRYFAGPVGRESPLAVACAKEGEAADPQLPRPASTDADAVTVVVARPNTTCPIRASVRKDVLGVVPDTVNQSKGQQQPTATRNRDQAEEGRAPQPQQEQHQHRGAAVLAHLSPDSLEHPPAPDTEDPEGHDSAQRKKRACANVTPKWAQNQSQDSDEPPPVFSVSRHRARLGINSLNSTSDPLPRVPTPDLLDDGAKDGPAPKILEESKFQRVERFPTLGTAESPIPAAQRKFSSGFATLPLPADREVGSEGRVEAPLRKYARQRSEQREQILLEERMTAIRQRATRYSSATQWPGDGAEPPKTQEAQVHSSLVHGLVAAFGAKCGEKSAVQHRNSMPSLRCSEQLSSAAAGVPASPFRRRLASAPLWNTRTLTKQETVTELLYEVADIINDFFPPRCANYHREFHRLPAARRTALAELYESHQQLRKQLGWEDAYQPLIDKDLSLVLQEYTRFDKSHPVLPALSSTALCRPSAPSAPALSLHKQESDCPTALLTAKEVMPPLQKQQPPPLPLVPADFQFPVVRHSESRPGGERKNLQQTEDRLPQAQRLTSFEIVAASRKASSSRCGSAKSRTADTKSPGTELHQRSPTKLPAVQKKVGSPKGVGTATPVKKRKDDSAVTVGCVVTAVGRNAADRMDGGAAALTSAEKVPPLPERPSPAQVFSMTSDATPEKLMATVAIPPRRRRSRRLLKQSSTPGRQVKENRKLRASAAAEKLDEAAKPDNEKDRLQEQRMPQIIHRERGGAPAAMTSSALTASAASWPTLAESDRQTAASKEPPTQLSPSPLRLSRRTLGSTTGPVQSSLLAVSAEHPLPIIDAVVSQPSDPFEALSCKRNSPPLPLPFRQETQGGKPTRSSPPLPTQSSCTQRSTSHSVSLPYMFANLSTESPHVGSGNGEAGNWPQRQSVPLYDNVEEGVNTPATSSVFLPSRSALAASLPESEIRTSPFYEASDSNLLSGLYELTPAESEVASEQRSHCVPLKRECSSERYDSLLCRYLIEPEAQLYLTSSVLGWKA
ncbi:hypothetical protein ABL78_3754 [Leptomonas seymouri]|uniref:Uncharacterized protein n=1 Tax=Leptomonas seymouri TaxID=5684 RepID=A0A0N1HXG9_LEPSE|nr:hypothetical protein ABL78_3754 [Leptomonas seymouri]|eukprot:KPI87152.1 hypothetical protein ABL78_3754 [Leptomonas seymouri]